jgi:hypothetical protein
MGNPDAIVDESSRLKACVITAPFLDDCYQLEGGQVAL